MCLNVEDVSRSIGLCNGAITEFGHLFSCVLNDDSKGCPSRKKSVNYNLWHAHGYRITFPLVVRVSSATQRYGMSSPLQPNNIINTIEVAVTHLFYETQMIAGA